MRRNLGAPATRQADASTYLQALFPFYWTLRPVIERAAADWGYASDVGSFPDDYGMASDTSNADVVCDMGLASDRAPQTGSI